jgi:hypothetical protein
MQYPPSVATEILMFLIPASYEPCSLVSVERLHARNRSADVRLRSGLVRPGAEAEVRGDRNREQDPEDDDHDQKLDEGEALLAPHLAESVRKTCKHFCGPP